MQFINKQQMCTKKKKFLSKIFNKSMSSRLFSEISMIRKYSLNPKGDKSIFFILLLFRNRYSIVG